MRTFLINIVKYFTITFIIVNIISFGANYFLRKSSFYKPSFLLKKIHEGDSLDFILAGSSRGLTTIDTRGVDTLLGTTGFNISLDDTGLPSHFLMIQHFYESGRFAKKCVLTLDEAHFSSSDLSLNSNDYRLAPFSDRAYVKNYFSVRETGFLKPLTYSSVIPILAYSYYNTELFFPALLSIVKPDYKNRFDDYGNYSYPEEESVPDPAYQEDFRTADINNPILLELKDYLESKGAELILYIAPYKKIRLTVSNHFGLRLINHSGILKDELLFYDDIHVNLAGKKAATLNFAESLQEILDLK